MVKGKIFCEEEQRLKYVVDRINKKIDMAQKNFSEQKNFIIGFHEGMRGTQFTREALMSLYSTEESDLKFLLDNPYFGKIVFKADNESESQSIYIGKAALIDDVEILSYDWRSPIASMYYDYSIGDAEYENNGMKVTGKILNKRQINIKKGKLLSVDEQDTLTDDKILIKYLTDNADSRLKSIVATIQKEQNKIIRSPLKNNYIIQGVAGSGKTTVALHRIAYLLYNEAKNIKESDFMILGPNKYFLNYISELLPDLDICSVRQSTFEQIALDNIDKKIKLESQNETLQNVLLKKEKEEIIKYKSSLEFLDLIENFVIAYLKNHLEKPILYEGIELCKANYLSGFMDFNYSRQIGQSYGVRINNISKIVAKKVKENSDDLAHSAWVKYKNEYLSLPKDSPRRKEIIEITDNMQKEIKGGCKKTINEAFKFTQISPLNLYISFISNLEQTMINNNKINVEELKKQTLEKLNNKKVGNADLAPMLLIKYLVSGIKGYEDYEHLVIDEGQDLSEAQYKILKNLFPKATFDIYGDLNQSIYAYQGIKSWEELNEKIFNCKGNLLELNKGYRTTEQISDAANYILRELNVNESSCVTRKGNDVILEETNNKLLFKIDEFLNKGYKTIAIICKDSIETDAIHKQLVKLGINIHKISEKDLTYNGGLCIMPSYLSKGLEFDAVIINDANNDIYNSDSIVDMKLLYVAMTRALHELHINYTNELTKPLKNMSKEKGYQKIKKNN